MHPTCAGPSANTAGGSPATNPPFTLRNVIRCAAHSVRTQALSVHRPWHEQSIVRGWQPAQASVSDDSASSPPSDSETSEFRRTTTPDAEVRAESALRVVSVTATLVPRSVTFLGSNHRSHQAHIVEATSRFAPDGISPTSDCPCAGSCSATAACRCTRPYFDASRTPRRSRTRS